MLIIIGVYFTNNFTGVYLTLLANFPLTSPYSYWWVQCSMHDATLQHDKTDTPFRKYGIEDFYLCVPTTNGVYGAYVYT